MVEDSGEVPAACRHHRQRLLCSSSFLWFFQVRSATDANISKLTKKSRGEREDLPSGDFQKLISCALQLSSVAALRRARRQEDRASMSARRERFPRSPERSPGLQPPGVQPVVLSDQISRPPVSELPREGVSGCVSAKPVSTSPQMHRGREGVQPSHEGSVGVPLSTTAHVFPHDFGSPHNRG